MENEKGLVVYCGVFIIVLLGLILFWVKSPLFHQFKGDERENIRVYIISNYWGMAAYEKDYYIKKYHFTEEELSCEALFNSNSDNRTVDELRRLYNKNPVIKFLIGE